MASPALDVLTVADMCVDLVLAGNVRPRFHQVEQLIGDYVLELGGSANIFASQFVKLGGRAGVIGCVGQDAFGGFVMSRLAELGIDLSRVRRDPRLKTGLGVALAEPDDRAILTYSGTIDATTPGDLREDLFPACRHWHTASYFLLASLRGHWPGWFRAAKQHGLSTSLDPGWDPAEAWTGVADILPWVDVFLPNDQEALAISGEASVERAGERLGGICQLVVIKCGAEGAMAFERGRYCAVPARPRADIVDAIGAGDNFDAGFLRAWLLGKPVIECLELARRCAYESLGAPGGIQGQLRE